MIRLVETGRVDDIGFLNRIDQFEQSYAGGLQPSEIGHDVELGNLATLHRDRADPIDPVERRLQVVGGDLPQARLRNRILAAVISREGIAENGECREREPVGGDACGCG